MQYDVCEPRALTTLLYEPEDGFYLLHRHVDRLCRAQKRLSEAGELILHTVDEEQLLVELWRVVRSFGVGLKQRVRVTIDANGYASSTTALLVDLEGDIPLCLDNQPTSCVLPVKTTKRGEYDSARSRVDAYTGVGPSRDNQPWDVLMWNYQGYITETGIANVAVEMPHDGSVRLVTPRTTSGLIPGVMREQLLQDGLVVEGDVSIEDLLSATRNGQRLFVFNALRRLLPAKIIPRCLSTSPDPSCMREASQLGPGVIIDCWDSFTNNLLPLLNIQDLSAPEFEKYLAENVSAIRLHDFEWSVFRDTILPYVDWIVISPGPGRPDNYEDFGFCADLFRYADVPILGVCLGHQGLAAAYGGRIRQSEEVMHGRYVDVHSSGNGILSGVTSTKMIRYNSLSVDLHNLPDVLEVTAWSRLPGNTGIEIMGLQHRYKPQFGVQFHLESTCSDQGTARTLMRNFASVVRQYRGKKGCPSFLPLTCRQASYIDFPRALKGMSPAFCNVVSPRFEVAEKQLSLSNLPAEVFAAITSRSGNDANCFWLDSARTSDAEAYGRFSYMGVSTRYLQYCEGRVLLTTGTGSKTVQLGPGRSFWGWLEDIQNDLHQKTRLPDKTICSEFRCGLIGYFGYEMGQESLEGYTPIKERPSTGIPDAEFMVVDRMVAFDHQTLTWHAVCLLRPSSANPPTNLEDALGTCIGLTTTELESWIQYLESQHIDLQHSNSQSTPLPDSFSFNMSRSSYLRRIEELQDAIGRGDSYEMNLTGQFRATLQTPLSATEARDLYFWLRNRNPAGQSAFISFPSTETYILSTSPELFIRLEGDDARKAIMKPIKGTLRRTLCTCAHMCTNPHDCEERRSQEDAQRLQAFISDPKERAENLMIVDLIKADLHNFCHTSSVRVTKLMDVEQSETVYSLVTTVEGQLMSEVGPVEAIRRSFPPGSMTGAPKLRTVQLLEELESHHPRGVYSGCIGYVGVDNRACFNVVIRTLVIRGCEASVGAGGAITWLSEAEKEWEEVYLKARSVLQERLSYPGEPMRA